MLRKILCFSFFVVFPYCSEVASDTVNATHTQEWFEQTLDHFNQSDSRTWKQRFFRIYTFYKTGGPVFLRVGGESGIQESHVLAGSWLHYAKDNGALCFILEHRFYGESRPTRSMTLGDLQYLSSKQARKDIAAFISAKKSDFPEGTKWMLFGSSYSGTVALFSKLENQDLIFGAVLSSAPRRTAEDLKGFFGIVAQALNETSPPCLRSLAAARKQVHSLLKTDVEKLSKMFHLCSRNQLRHQKDIYGFYFEIAGNIAATVTTNAGGQSVNYNFHGKKRLHIDDVCSTMLDSSTGDELDRLAKLVEIYLHNFNYYSCLDNSYNSSLLLVEFPTWYPGSRQWFYQGCTEFGLFMTSTLKITRQVFGNFPLEYFTSKCQDVFGISPITVQQNVDRSNEYQDGLFDKALKNGGLDHIVFVHGSLDPYTTLVGEEDRRDLGPKTPFIFINGTSHTTDASTPSSDDPPQLKEARKKIAAYISRWLAE